MDTAIHKQVSKYRQRGYVCTKCGETAMIFGADTEPTVCPTGDGQPVKKAWDHIVETTTEVRPYVGV